MSASLFDMRSPVSRMVLDDPSRNSWARYTGKFLGLTDAADLVANLQATRGPGSLPWRREARDRYACGIGSPGVRYTYGVGEVRQTHDAQPWPAWFLPILEAVRGTVGERFDFALLNLYETGDGALGWHSDKEDDLKPGSPIASLSLGAERDFQWRLAEEWAVRPTGGASGQRVAAAPGQTTTLQLEHGSLLVMGGEMQRWWEHQVPARKRVSEARFNVTFRRLR